MRMHFTPTSLTRLGRHTTKSKDFISVTPLRTSLNEQSNRKPANCPKTGHGRSTEGRGVPASGRNPASSGCDAKSLVPTRSTEPIPDQGWSGRVARHTPVFWHRRCARIQQRGSCRGVAHRPSWGGHVSRVFGELMAGGGCALRGGSCGAKGRLLRLQRRGVYRELSRGRGGLNLG